MALKYRRYGMAISPVFLDQKPSTKNGIVRPAMLFLRCSVVWLLGAGVDLGAARAVEVFELGLSNKHCLSSHPQRAASHVGVKLRATLGRL